MQQQAAPQNFRATDWTGLTLEKEAQVGGSGRDGRAGVDKENGEGDGEQKGAGVENLTYGTGVVGLQWGWGVGL